MLEISLMLIVLYVPLWLGTLIFFAYRGRRVNRLFQIMHTIYFVLFSVNYHFQGTFDLPNDILLTIHLTAAFYFTYRFLRTDEHEESESRLYHLKPETRRAVERFQKTVDQVFANNKESVENKKSSDLDTLDQTNLDTNPQNQQL